MGSPIRSLPSRVSCLPTLDRDFRTRLTLVKRFERIFGTKDSLTKDNPRVTLSNKDLSDLPFLYHRKNLSLLFERDNKFGFMILFMILDPRKISTKFRRLSLCYFQLIPKYNISVGTFVHLTDHLFHITLIILNPVSVIFASLKGRNLLIRRT